MEEGHESKQGGGQQGEEYNAIQMQMQMQHEQQLMREQHMQQEQHLQQQQQTHHQDQLQREQLMQREQQLQHEQMSQQQQQQQQQQHQMTQQQQQHHMGQKQEHHGQHMQSEDDLRVAAEDIITAVNSIGEASSGLDNGMGEQEHTQQEQAAAVETLAVAGPAPPLLLLAERCLSIQEIVDLCKEFEVCDKISRREFAKVQNVSRTKFDRYWKNYRVGKYNNVKLASKRRRVKPGKYLAVENKLIEFLEDRKAQGIKNDLSWLVLSEKALELSKDSLSEPLQATFKASAGWLNGVLHRNGLIHVNDLTGAVGVPAVVPPMKAPSKLTPQPAIVFNEDMTMV
jgi:hypothetical protein